VAEEVKEGKHVNFELQNFSANAKTESKSTPRSANQTLIFSQGTHSNS